MPPRWEVGGVLLRPFCLRHLITLQSINHPFVTDGMVPEPDDVVLALRICSSDLGIAAMESKATWGEKWLNGKMIASPHLMAKTIAEFVRYTELYSSTPKVWEKNEDKGSIDIRKEKIPDILMLVGLLICKTTLREEDVWTMPIGKISWYATAVAVMEGANVETISTADEIKFEAEKEALARYEKEQLAKFKGDRANRKPTNTQ